MNFFNPVIMTTLSFDAFVVFLIVYLIKNKK